MINSLTEIIFLLDRSGSMSGLENDTIGGFNSLTEKQSKLDGETAVTVVLFDHEYEVLWNGIDAKRAKLTKKDYYVRGTTALLDAVGKTILEVDQRLLKTNEERLPGNIIFVITTDGMENASREFSHDKVKQLIKRQQDEYNWEFIFMGANIDAAKEAGNIGIDVEHAYSFEASNKGVENMYVMAEEAITLKRKKK
ncbi:vWA domain-containing protein [Radiobacillus sp. PE A8.2]|uniref:vWA domain-containing protein n=1 Tax=Radiobacillus sp. PE A8.2 TaxID=3380349 RepID=UPI00389084FD